MEVIELIDSMRLVCKRLAQRGNRPIRFVPTMGSLHAGHGSLIKRAKEDKHDEHDDDHDEEVTVKQITGAEQQQTQMVNDNQRHINRCGKEPKPIVIVSIFVNPIQFNQRQDFLQYPQTLESDLEMCQSLNVDYVFVPKAEDIYDDQQGASCLIKPPEMLEGQLEAKSRQGHFEGMLTIVCKLFNIIRPNRAYFGEKDFQQLVLVKKMVKALNMDVDICPVETTRDPSDNLPLSSRNVRLEQRHRRKAAVMYDILMDTKRVVQDKCRLNFDANYPPFDLETITLGSMLATECLAAAVEMNNDQDEINPDQNDKDSFIVDYLELRCAEDLTAIKYEQHLGSYDCQLGCVARQISLPEERAGNLTLKARLLIAVVVGGVRLLDNVEVILNVP